MPHVLTHNAASVDGRIDGIDVDLGTFYGLASEWAPDAHLVGSDTLIEGMAGAVDDRVDAPADPSPDSPNGPPSDPVDAAPESAPGDGASGSSLLVVPDSRGRVVDWSAVLAQPFWEEAVVLCSRSTDESYVAGLEEVGVDAVVAGDDHVDYAEALGTLEADYDVATVLVDSGGTLNGHLLRAGLVDEVSVLVHPQVVGGESARPFVRGPDPSEASPVADCSLEATKRLDGGLLWLRYAVERA